jgi:hypothetical protein
MSLSVKEQMIEFLRKRDSQIQEIKDDQLQIVKAYVKGSYNITEKDIFFLNDTKVKLHHITFSDSGRKINLHYQRVKYNGGIESKLFTTCLSNHIKITKE